MSSIITRVFDYMGIGGWSTQEIDVGGSQTLTFVAAADIRAGDVVWLTFEGEVAPASVAATSIIGVAVADCAQGDTATVQYAGKPPVRCRLGNDQEISPGDLVTQVGAGTPASRGLIAEVGDPDLRDAMGIALEAGEGDVRATLSVNDNMILSAAAEYPGVAGDVITFEILDDSTPNLELAVSIVGTAIVVTPATDGGGIIVGNYSDVRNAIISKQEVLEIWLVDNPEVTGSDDITPFAEAPLAGGADTAVDAFILVTLPCHASD
jgi:hypothetical protein